MNIFKNFKTKRQLREEIERLRYINRPQISVVEREVQKISCCMEITDIADKVPIEVIKKKIAMNFAEQLEPFVEWDLEDSSNEHRYGKIVRGSIYLARRK